MAFFTNVLTGALQRGQQIRDDKENQRRQIIERAFQTLDGLKDKRTKQLEEMQAMQRAARSAVASGYVEGSEDDVVAYLYTLPEAERLTAANEIRSGLRTGNIRRPGGAAPSTAAATAQTQQMLGTTNRGAPTSLPQAPQRRESLMQSFLGGSVTDGLSDRLQREYMAANPGMTPQGMQELLSGPQRPELAPGTQIEVRETPKFGMTESMLQQMTPEQYDEYAAANPSDRARIEAELARQAGVAEEQRRMAEIEARRRETPQKEIPLGQYKRVEAALMQEAGLGGLLVPDPANPGSFMVNMPGLQQNPDLKAKYAEVQRQLADWEMAVRGGMDPQEALIALTTPPTADSVLGDSDLGPLQASMWEIGNIRGTYQQLEEAARQNGLTVEEYIQRTGAQRVN